MYAICIILGLIIVVSFVIGYIKTIWDNSNIKKNSVADNPKITFDIKDDKKDKKKDDLELL